MAFTPLDDRAPRSSRVSSSLRTIAAALLGGASLVVLADLATVHAQQQPQPGQQQPGQPPKKKVQPTPQPKAATPKPTPIPPKAGGPGTVRQQVQPKPTPVQPKPIQAQPKPAPVQPRIAKPPQPPTVSKTQTPTTGGGQPKFVPKKTAVPPPSPKTTPTVATPGRTVPPPNARRTPPNTPQVPSATPTVKTGVPKPGFVPQQATPVIPGKPRVGTVVRPPPGPASIQQVKAARVVKTDPRLGSRVTTEPGNRSIIRKDNRVVVHRNETTVIQNFYPGARTVRRPGGLTQTTYVRRDGVRVVSEVDGAGRLIRRFGQGPSGRPIVYVDNRRFYRNLAIGVGVAAVGIGLAVALAPPAVAIPRQKYIVDYERASEDDIYEALSAPPIEKIDRPYSLEEIRYSAPLRDRMRRVDLDTINFEFGSFEVTPDQYPKLERIARAIARAIEQNPGEMYLIEGHTDAVGEQDDNLSLSDRRAEAVSRVLVEHFNIPMENLTTQGYGEQHLKVDTREAERVNRRVAIRRITPLLNQTAEEGSEPPPPRQ